MKQLVARKIVYPQREEPAISLRGVSPDRLRSLVRLHKSLRDSTFDDEEEICRDALEIIDQMQTQPRGFPPGGARSR
jgi:hypothetical protein